MNLYTVNLKDTTVDRTAPWPAETSVALFLTEQGYKVESVTIKPNGMVFVMSDKDPNEVWSSFTDVPVSRRSETTFNVGIIKQFQAAYAENRLDSNPVLERDALAALAGIVLAAMGLESPKDT